MDLNRGTVADVGWKRAFSCSAPHGADTVGGTERWRKAK